MGVVFRQGKPLGITTRVERPWGRIRQVDCRPWSAPLFQRKCRTSPLKLLMMENWSAVVTIANALSDLGHLSGRASPGRNLPGRLHPTGTIAGDLPGGRPTHDFIVG